MLLTSTDSRELSLDANSGEPSQEIKVDNESIFAAEQILKQRVMNGKKQYLVKWVGYPIKEATWEPEENILDKRLIDAFKQPRV